MSANLHHGVTRGVATGDLTALPPLASLWREAQAIADVRRFAAPPAVARRSEGAPVMVIPGFLSTDGSTMRLRRALGAAGYRAYGWQQGRNLGATPARLDRLTARIVELARRHGAPVALVGWSLGGLYARETAKRVPDCVARVVTMGTPFSGDPRANRAWRLYEIVNRHPVDRVPIECDLSAKPPVRTIALWSRGDGVIAPACARGLPHEADVAIELGCGHIGFTFEAEAIEAVLDALED